MAAKKGKKLSPMMEQYQTMRRSLPDDVILFFRLGDFYEMFFDDAIRAAEVLNVALTKRHDIPMCGVPHHASQGYIAKMVQQGIRVAIAEQTSVPQAGKLVERAISQIISAGTVNDLNLLDDTKHNYLAAVYQFGKLWGLACADHTTGEFTVAEFTTQAALEDELHRLKPSELIYADDQADIFEHLEFALAYDGRSCDHLTAIKVRESKDFVLIDTASQQNLDLVDSRSGKKHTLLGVLDKTSTPMGARKLRDWILHPLKDLEVLLARQDFLQAFIEQPFVLAKAKESLKGIKDIERTSSRLSQGAGNPRDLLSLAVSLEKIPALKEDVAAISAQSDLAESLLLKIKEFKELVELFSVALADEPPVQIKDGGIIRDGYSEELDEVRKASTEGKNWIAKLQQEEREKSGIDNLKIKFNNVFGYFIEVSKGKVAQVPERYERKQTMANAERYITPELKEIESKVLGAEERSKQIEYEAFIHLREQVCDHLVDLQLTATALAELDVLLGLAQVAQLYDHVRPLINEPNMAGKSTYIRQVALITLMAQIGAFVPAESSTIGLVDRIFCRVGASDDLTKGQSTFMVEMNETALIINNATEHSLVVLDEIGRGTATFDGLSIAWSVAEHLHDNIKARTLFATHYHELTDLAYSRDAVQNYNVAVREWNDEIIFLRKIVAGTADKSYGIQVARLAGLPKNIIDRAKDILSHLEMNSSKPDTSKKPKPKNKKTVLPDSNSPQMDLFT